MEFKINQKCKLNAQKEGNILERIKLNEKPKSK